MYECNNIEFKSEINEKLEKEVVGFLNGNGGHIYLGIENDGETIVGFEDIDQAQLLAKDRIKDKIAPSPIGFFELIVEERENKKIIHVIVARGNEKPYYLKKYGMCPLGAFVRVGSSLSPLTEKQIFDMYSKRTRTSLINIISPIKKLTFTQLKIYYEEIGYEINPNLYSQLNFKMENGEFNYLAYLLSDQNSLVINVGKFKGNDVYDLEELKSYSNQSLVKTTHEIVDYIESVNKTFTKITSLKRIEEKLFDSVAMREAIINAIVHSDYSYENSPTFRIFDDHIEIISVGGLPEGIEKDEFLNGFMSPKNPQLMKIFRDLGFVEHMGTGIIRILKKYDKSVFNFSTNFIKVSIPYKNGLGELTSNKNNNNNFLNLDITNRQRELVDLINQFKNITQEELASKLNVSRYTIMRDLKSLEEKNIVSRDGSNKTGYWKVNN